MLQKAKQGTSLMLHWLRFWASNAGGTSSIPGWRTEVPSAVLWSQKKKKKNPMNKKEINKKPQEAKQGREGSCSPTQCHCHLTQPSPCCQCYTNSQWILCASPSPNDSLPTPIPKGLSPAQSPVSTIPFPPSALTNLNSKPE